MDNQLSGPVGSSDSDAGILDLVRPADLKVILLRHGIHLSRRFGQHFLINRHVLERMITTAEVEKGDQVLEIGPGSGVLTRALARSGADVVAIELDRAMLGVLEETVGNIPEVRVVAGDALRLDWSALLPADRSAKVVANIPYNITAPLVAKMCQHVPRFRSMSLLVQKEVANRMIARPGDSDFGSLSLFVQYYATVRKAMDVGPDCFLPPPKVTSAIVHLIPQPPPVPVAPDDFFRITRAAFGQRRKTLRNSVSSGLGLAPSVVSDVLVSVGVDPEARAEVLDMEAYGRIAVAFRDLSVDGNT